MFEAVAALPTRPVMQACPKLQIVDAIYTVVAGLILVFVLKMVKTYLTAACSI